ncbi:MAG TPA: hypothetical protein VEA63_16135 [Opitutus sp.]|nr:hypothetical protein [Opitutus sp.]
MSVRCMRHRDLIPYKDRSGDSGVRAYTIETDAIIVEFKSGGGYRYDSTAPGRRHVAAMKKLAQSGDGLATYINQHVRDDYAEKLW